MKKRKLLLFDIAITAIAGALLIVSQIALSFIPNVELVSLLVIVFSLNLRSKAIGAIYVFALIEGLIYGFGVWWIMYLYVWTVLYLITIPFREMESSIGWAIISGIFGLLFGALCSIPYFFIMGFGGGIAYFVNGLLFDFIHCAGNFVVALVLFRPLNSVLKKLMGYYGAYL